MSVRTNVLALALILSLAAPAAANPAASGRAAPAPGPRVIVLGDAVAGPVDLAISPKEITLIRFETGDVSMVAVGDTAMVSVTVKGPDVLLKALALSGRTNAFIWVAGQYTQWTLVIRDARDPRVIVVRDAPVNGDKPGAQGRSVTVSSAYTPPKPAPAPVASPQPPAPGAPPAQAPAGTGQQSATTVAPSPPRPTGAPGGPGGTEAFLRSLSSQQAALYAALMQEPTLDRLGALIRGLSAVQQLDLLVVLAAAGLGRPPAAPSPQPTASPTSGQGPQATPPPSVQAQPTATPAPAPATTAGGPPAPPGPAAPLPVLAARVGTQLPSGVALSITPTVVGGQLFINYILQNQGEATLLADSLRLRILDGAGNRLGWDITRTSQSGYVGRLGPREVEAGVITVATTQKALTLEWTLVEVGTGAQLVARAQIVLP